MKPKEVKTVADARDIEGLAGYPWIIIAANPHLSNTAICNYLGECGIPGVERSPSWVQRRRWMFRSGSSPGAGRAADLDGKQSRALTIMQAHPEMSVRRLVYLLKENGIKRQREWVRKHRVTG